MKRPRSNISHTTVSSALAIALLLLHTTLSFAAKPIYSGGKERAAIRGYDTVSYFTENKPIKGSEDFSYEYQDAKWLFSNQKNLDLFKSNPTKYAPQFGGYCAYAVSKNTTASIKPQYFTIHDGKLYLNYSKPVYKRWLKDRDGLIQKAESNWPSVLSE